jgi:uncharacterized membrane protein
MNDFLISCYDSALIALQWLGGEVGLMGLGYQIANIVLFVFIQPSLIILFFVLWQLRRSKNRVYNQKRSREAFLSND